MSISTKFYYMAKVIISCKTVEQLNLCKAWTRNKGLDIDQYFELQYLIIEVERKLVC